MSILFGILLSLLVFSVIVFFHELGHFMAARRAGVKVEEFGIGIPPKAMEIGKDKKGTLYTLNWFPIGGFVKLKGEDELSAKAEDSFAHKGYFAKSSILLAGVTMNFILAWVIFLGLFWSITNPNGVAPIAINTKFATETKSLLVPTYEQAKTIGIIETDGILLDPIEGSPAASAGILKDDIIQEINGKSVKYSTDLLSALESSPNELVFKITRNKETKIISVKPKDGKIGAYIGDNITNIRDNFTYSYGFFTAAQVAGEEVWWQSKLTFELLANLVRKLVSPNTPTERTEATKSLSGPIGIGNVFVNMVEKEVPISIIFAIAALISINLGVFNLLPFPALDGGRFAFLSIHTILSWVSRGKYGTNWIENKANLIGFALLMLASIFIAYQDIVRIIYK
ncbi:MAG: site-2 protease family protein [Candidatus Gracilibacteria bacterium]|nr:site-2 protease family protein [Candidatus Gracilibacteria bacterium]